MFYLVAPTGETDGPAGFLLAGRFRGSTTLVVFLGASASDWCASGLFTGLDRAGGFDGVGRTRYDWEVASGRDESP